jgi:YidC/Oxa1 family membrane protein insertase
VLNFIYYPVSFILWCWHWVFSHLLGATDPTATDSIAGGIAWALSVVFLVFTLRALLYKPFVLQVRSMRKMQEFQPEMAKIRKKYANDRQKQAAEMQRLQQEHGVNPIMGCLPMLVQVPVFIGLFHVLRSFGPVRADGQPGNLDGSVRTENYFFDHDGVLSFNNASLFGAKLGSWVTQGSELLAHAGTSIPSMIIVMAPLMVAAGIFTHITARHSVARQTAAQGENPQTAIMNKLMLYVFPIGVVVGAPFLPLAILLYWVSNNLWTLGQQYVVYRRIDAEETAKKDEKDEKRQALAPKVGQKPVRPEHQTTDEAADEKKPGAKPIARKAGVDTTKKASTNGSSNGSATNGSANGSGVNGTAAKVGSNGSANNGATNGATSGSGSGAKKPGSAPVRSGNRRPRKRR